MQHDWTVAHRLHVCVDGALPCTPFLSQPQARRRHALYCCLHIRSAVNLYCDKTPVSICIPMIGMFFAFDRVMIRN
jgi:hypothetical protein